MSAKFAQRVDELDPKRIRVHLSAGVQEAFADLAAAVHFSEHFDAGALQTVKDLAGGKPLTVDDVIGSLPLIAENAFDHIHATGDVTARRAWQKLGNALLEEGFSLRKGRGRTD